ncbi:hypothetical protein FWH30_02390 [Microgenomates group bacterium]|nr:hypothetical protein [Microgenomates group bacterium]
MTKKSKKGNLSIVIISIVGLIALGVGWFLFSHNQASNRSTSTTSELSSPKPTTTTGTNPETADREFLRWNGFSVAPVDNWQVVDEGLQFFDLQQVESNALDVPSLHVRYIGGAAHMTPDWYIEDKSSQDWVQKSGEIRWVNNVTINGIEYLMAEYTGSRYQTFWLLTMPSTPSQDYDTSNSVFLALEFEWIDLAGARQLLETVEIDWSATPL